MNEEGLKNRTDINKLVLSFYTKIRKNDEIGYFFNNSIQDWNTHLEKLTDFWESNLFFTGSFLGNPAVAHVKVDTENNHNIS